MLKKLTQFFSRDKDSPSQASHIPAEHHGINPKSISAAAIKVIETLQDEGWEAYLVGGGVRDSLLGNTPKDFDVATNATPEKVSNIFRRSRIVGRRFKIVHVRMGRELIEVTTFRGAHEAKNAARQASQNEKGMLLRDNVYGDLESDAKRRDFTINALYYDPTQQTVIDFCGGVDDLQQQTLRMIGDPASRYKEDPVRMLRAVRFKAKLNFELDPSTKAPIRDHAHYLKDIPSARLFEEVLKLFLSGKAKHTLETLHEFELLEHLFPSVARVLNGDDAFSKNLLYLATENTDKRIASNKRVTPAFIYAAFLWPALQEEIAILTSQSRGNPQDILYRASDAVIYEQQKRTAIPKRFQIPMKEIWSLQHRFKRRDAKRAFSLLEHKRFRAAYDFVLLREQAGERLGGLGDWWTTFQFADKDTQLSMLEKTKSNRRRGPKKNKTRATQDK